jgi:hypothetical protein
MDMKGTFYGLVKARTAHTVALGLICGLWVRLAALFFGVVLLLRPNKVDERELPWPHPPLAPTNAELPCQLFAYWLFACRLFAWSKTDLPKNAVSVFRGKSTF